MVLFFVHGIPHPVGQVLGAGFVGIVGLFVLPFRADCAAPASSQGLDAYFLVHGTKKLQAAGEARGTAKP